jgi:hypothetical protein
LILSEHNPTTAVAMQPMLIARAGMNIMESQLLWEFIAFLKARWSARSRVDQRRRRLRQLVAMVRAVADAAESRGGGGGAGAASVRDGSLSAWLHVLRSEALRGQEVLEASRCDAAAVAGSARNFLAGIRTLLARSAEVDRLTDAVEELERLAGPGGDLDMFVKVLRLDRPARATAMEVDGGAGGRREEEDDGSSSRAGSGSGPATGAKRKWAASTSGGGGSSAPHGQVDNTAQQLPKRRALSWLPAGFGALFAATREPPPPPPVVPRSHRARAVAAAMVRIRRRIDKPTTRRRRQQLQQQQQILGQRLSRISL